MTARDVAMQMEAEYRATLVDTFNRIGLKKNPALDARAVAYLEKMSRFFACEDAEPVPPIADTASIEDLLPLGQALISGGCDDPLVLFCHGHLLLKSYSPDEALAQLRNAFAKFKAGQYPDLCVARAAHDLIRVTDAEAEQHDARAESWARLTKLCQGKHSSIQRRLVIDLIGIETNGFNSVPFALLQLREPDADPWIASALKGLTHISSAWGARGGSSASAVGEAEWKEFFEDLGHARDELTAAWKIAPELPEAPTGMIAVAMGAGERLDEKTDTWFERARAAQVDYTPAYDHQGTALLPRWGGSHQQMLNLARQCMEHPDYNSLLPWQYVRLATRMGADVGDRWSVLSSPEMTATIGKVFDGYAAAFGPGKNTYFRTARAALAWRLNKLDEGRRLLDAMVADGLRPDPKAFEFLGASNGNDMIGFVYAGTSPNRDEIAGIGSALKTGDKAGALDRLRKLRAKLPPADMQAPFLESKISDIDADLKFEAGDWSPMLRSKSLNGWAPTEGKWALDPHGRVVGLGSEEEFKTLVWHPIGGSFEASVRVSRATMKCEPHCGGGFTLFNRANGRRGFIEMNLWTKQAIFYFPRPLNATYPADWEKDGSEITIRCKDYVVSALIDGKPVGNPVTLPDDFRNELSVGLGSSLGADANLLFDSPRIRKLKE